MNARPLLYALLSRTLYSGSVLEEGAVPGARTETGSAQTARVSAKRARDGDEERRDEEEEEEDEEWTDEEEEEDVEEEEDWPSILRKHFGEDRFGAAVATRCEYTVKRLLFEADAGEVLFFSLGVMADDYGPCCITVSPRAMLNVGFNLDILNNYNWNDAQPGRWEEDVLTVARQWVVDASGASESAVPIQAEEEDLWTRPLHEQDRWKRPPTQEERDAIRDAIKASKDFFTNPEAHASLWETIERGLHESAPWWVMHRGGMYDEFVATAENELNILGCILTFRMSSGEDDEDRVLEYQLREDLKPGSKEAQNYALEHLGHFL